MSGNKKINPFIVVAISILLLGILACISYSLLFQQTIIKDGNVRAGMVEIADEKYVYTAFETIGRTTRIAEIDNWDIYEVSEDPEHIFLKMKSFTGEHYIVRQDYQIPIDGKVNCAYVDGERVTDENILEALTDILSQKYDSGTLYYIADHKEEKDKWKHIVVGYEDCPVGTDYSIYGIANIDSKWVIVFRNDVGKLEGNKFPVLYHEINQKHYETFEQSKIFSH